jgi:hypothetical protein
VPETSSVAVIAPRVVVIFKDSAGAGSLGGGSTFRAASPVGVYVHGPSPAADSAVFGWSESPQLDNRTAAVTAVTKTAPLCMARIVRGER